MIGKYKIVTSKLVVRNIGIDLLVMQVAILLSLAKLVLAVTIACERTKSVPMLRPR